jgi:hypothetical protein
MSVVDEMNMRLPLLLWLALCGACDGRATMTDAQTRLDSNGPCVPDQLEPNDTRDSPRLVSSTVLSPIAPPLAYADLSIHRLGDEDWIGVQVDQRAPGGPNPLITARLFNLPTGEDYDIGLWSSCNAGTAPTCVVGTLDGSFRDGGCVAAGPENDSVRLEWNCAEAGAVFVRVHSPSWNGSCGTYALDVEAQF